MAYNQKNFWSKFLSSRLLLSVLVLAIIFISYAIIKEKKEQRVVRQNINSLQSEISGLKNKSLDLAEMIKYLRSDEFVEREARQKLSMRKEGEKVVIIPDTLDNLKVAGDYDVKNKKNWELWLEYFFGRQ